MERLHKRLDKQRNQVMERLDERLKKQRSQDTEVSRRLRATREMFFKTLRKILYRKETKVTISFFQDSPINSIGEIRYNPEKRVWATLLHPELP